MVVDPGKKLTATLERAFGASATIERAATADTALQTLAIQPFDLVVLQLRLSLFSGLELAYKLKRVRPEMAVVGVIPASAGEDGEQLFKFGYPPPVIYPENEAELVKRCRDTLAGERWQAKGRAVREELKKSYGFDQILSASPEMRAVHDRLKRVVSSKVPVLVTGESGTGKELVARMVHQTGDRVKKPFITVNCAAVPEGLLESQFFGHEKGAFTGAFSRTPGKFELANTGTLFLDEVGELSPALQAKLLRVLEYGEFERVGGIETLKVDVRLITATNRSLEEMVAVGTFRADLYYRINVFPIQLPPLRNRGEDITLLTFNFLHNASIRNNRQVKIIDPEALNLLFRYCWPGNIRELENAIERAVLLSDGVSLKVDDFPAQADWCSRHVPVEELEETFNTSTYLSDGSLDEIRPLADMEREAVKRAIDITAGNVALAARKLGIARGTLYKKMEEHGIPSRTEGDLHG